MADRRSPESKTPTWAPRRMLRELLGLAARIGVPVRAEPFGLKVLEGRGGLCWLQGKPVIVMDSAMPVIDKVGVLASALTALDLPPMYVSPILRGRVMPRGRP